MHTNANLVFRKIKSLKFLYEINENGTIIRNVKSKKQLKIKLDTHHSECGYYVTFVRLNHKPKRVMIHRAVAECWLGDIPAGMEVDHIDRNTHNNHYTNLRYVTKSEQMKNRDHTNIAATGSQNLANARDLRAHPVFVTKGSLGMYFYSVSACAKYLALVYNTSPEKMRYKLRNKRKKVFDYNIFYEMQRLDTVAPRSKEQSTNSDLTGDYTTAFNEGKQQEVEMRVKHYNGQQRIE